MIKIVDKLRRTLFFFVTTDFQKKIPLDKQRHVTVCFYGAVGLSSILMTVLPAWLAIVIGVSVMFLAGVAYEFYQKYSGKGVFDLKDILADAVGAVIGGSVVLVTSFIVTELLT